MLTREPTGTGVCIVHAEATWAGRMTKGGTMTDGVQADCGGCPLLLLALAWQVEAVHS